MKPLLTLILLLISALCQAECPIECFCDRVTTCTGDKLLSNFPLNLLQSSFQYSTSGYVNTVPVRVELHEYGVKHLGRKEFLQLLGNLTEISISRNSLETFDNDTFWADTTTSSNGGDTRTVRNIFLPLRILDLSQNKLRYFVGGQKLGKVKILDLSSNQLQQVYQLEGLESLESVNLRDNRISYLEANIFQNLRNLQYVNLDTNSVGTLDPSTFSNLPALAHLILSNNPISNLLPGFLWNSRVQFVDVSKVGLTSVPSSLTKSVRDFRAANNQLTVIKQTDFESYPNVGLVVLDENQIENVEDDAFGRLDFLARLWINGNRLRRIPQNLPPSLRSLQLEDNRINNLTLSDFHNLRKLEELNLHSNRITSLPPFIFAELSSLKSLDLRSNLIDVIYRDSFANLSKLETLDISQNPLKVIVTGAFASLRKVSLLHMSRLMEPIELDTKSFQSLQSVQILELDDSPHLTYAMLQDGALSSSFPFLIEVNIQRCNLEDVNLASNALIELGELSTVKMSGNPWDCQDLHGSAIYELISRRVIVDQPECVHPEKLNGRRLTSLQNDDHNRPSSSVTPSSGKNSSSQSTSITTATPTDQNLNSHEQEVKEKVATRVPSSSSPFTSENKTASSGSNNSLSGVVLMTKPRLSFSFQNSFPHALPTASTVKNATSALSSYTSQPTTNAARVSQQASPSDHRPAATPPASNNKTSGVSTLLGDLFDGDGDAAVPTQSYFDYTNNNNNNNNGGDGGGSGRDSYSRTRNSGAVKQGTSTTARSKSPPATNLLPISTSTSNRRPAASKKTKTNDDNTIIDGDGGSSRNGGAEVEREKQAGVEDGRSIDGFPLAYPQQSSASNPQYSYLKLQDGAKQLQRRGDLPSDHHGSTSHNTGVIVKTLLISALSCLVTILSLFLVSLVIYRRWCSRTSGSFQMRRSGRVIFPCARRCTRENEGEDTPTHDQGAGMMYTRFGKRKSRRDSVCGANSSLYSHNHQTESDLDQVELSGISNSLYFENEEIYHIT